MPALLSTEALLAQKAKGLLHQYPLKHAAAVQEAQFRAFRPPAANAKSIFWMPP